MGVSNNYLKPLLSMYQSSKEWLNDIYPRELTKIESKYNQVRGTNYESIPGNSNKKVPSIESIYSDELEELHNKLALNSMVVDHCEIAFRNVREEYFDIFDMYFRKGYTLRSVAMRTGYSRSRIHAIIDLETDRLSK